jgi:hypothetical protein
MDMHRYRRSENNKLLMRLTMKKRTITHLTSFVLLIVTVICIITGILKWPGLINAMGLTYRDLPMNTITWIHDWSGILMAVIMILHLVLYKNGTKSMIKTIKEFVKL